MNDVVPAPLRRLAHERGRILGELGVRVDDAAWVRAEASALSSLTTPVGLLRLPTFIARLLRRFARAVR